MMTYVEFTPFICALRTIKQINTDILVEQGLNFSSKLTNFAFKIQRM